MHKLPLNTNSIAKHKNAVAKSAAKQVDSFHESLWTHSHSKEMPMKAKNTFEYSPHGNYGRNLKEIEPIAAQRI